VTTLDPGASVVFTHGLALRPFLLALRARSPAASMTDGLDVLVHEVMAAMATAPWSSVKSLPSWRVTRVGFETEEGLCDAWWCSCDECSSSGCSSPGSDAGKLIAVVRSTMSWSTCA